MPFEYDVASERFADIRVIGVGGAGNNAVNRMIESGLQGVKFIAVNTDNQVLSNSLAENKIQIGTMLTNGRGAGANPEVGGKSADENLDDIIAQIEGADLLFITAGMGGGTGTGASPVIAEAAKKLGILTVGVVTTPFSFEGRIRRQNAEMGISLLKENIDALIIIPNDRIINFGQEDISFTEAFRMADEVLLQGVKGISDLISITGIVNLDFADVKQILKDAKVAHMGVGTATGEDKAVVAAQKAILSPLLETSIKGATRVLINITGDEHLSLKEVYEAAEIATESAHCDAEVIFGANIDPSMTNEIKITIIAADFVDSNYAANNTNRLDEESETLFPFQGL